MPSNYAHYRFGRELLPALPADLQRSVRRFRRLFDMGLQGPDLFFYHNIFVKTRTRRLGSTLHHTPGADFFPQVCRALGPRPTEAAQVYLWGLLAHYCLDSHCHPFVHAQTDEGSIGHVELETEFDRFLLEQDGKVPHAFDNSPHIRLTRGECVTVAGFYPPTTPGQINTAAKNMARCIHLLSIAHGKKRKIGRLVTGLVGGSTPQHLMPLEANPKCAHLDAEMLSLYRQALEHFPTLLQQLRAHLEHGTALGVEFIPTFG